MWKCAQCGEMHDEMPLCYGAEAPAIYSQIPEKERRKRAVLDDERCVVDKQHFFVKGRICIPVHGSDEPFVWLVWVSLSKPNFERTLKLWKTPGRESEPPYFGWLSTELPVYPSTLNLRTAVQTMPVGERSLVVVGDEEHPLAREQEDGITMSRVQEIAEQLLHS